MRPDIATRHGRAITDQDVGAAPGAGSDVAARVRHRLAVSGDEVTPATVASAIEADPRTAVLGDTTLRRFTDQVQRDLVGAGPLAPLLLDPQVTDVLVNGPGQVWIDRGVGLEPTNLSFGSADDVRRLAQRLASACGRRLDEASPYVDARLPDGTRVHAVLPPIAVAGPYLSLRTFRQRAYTLRELVELGTVPAPVAELLAAVVSARLTYLVTGAAGAGKTTLLGTLVGLVPPDERIVVVEDSTELRPAHPHVVALQTRMSNVEGTGAVPLRELVRQALRMRPDRLVIGECRGEEVVDLLMALNTGHDGGAGTLHANTPADVPARLEALGLLGGVPRAALHAQVAAAVQVVVHLRRTGDGRTVDEVCVLRPTGRDRLVVAVPVWRRGYGVGPAAAELSLLLAARGVPAPGWLPRPPSVNR